MFIKYNIADIYLKKKKRLCSILFIKTNKQKKIINICDLAKGAYATAVTQ